MNRLKPYICIFFYRLTLIYSSPISQTASLQRGKTPPTRVLVYDTKQSDGEAPVILELWEVRSTRLLPSLPGQLFLWMLASDRVPLIGQIVLNCVLMLNWITWNHHHHLVVPLARISLTLSRHSSLLLVGPQGYIPYHYRAAVCMFELVALLLLGHVRGPIGEDHLFLQQCPARLFRLTLIVFVICLYL